MVHPLRPESVRVETAALAEEAVQLTVVPWVRETLRRTPWWATSALLHLAVLLAATMVAFQGRPVEVDPGRTTLEIPRTPPPKMPEPPRTPIDRDKLTPDPDQDPDGHPVQPEVYDPRAELSDHWETDDGLPFREVKGDSLDFMSMFVGKAGGKLGNDPDTRRKGMTDALGIGGGGGGAGRWGNGQGGLRWCRMKSGTGVHREFFLAGLRWLARHQAADGSWAPDRFHERCRGAACGGPGMAGHEVGITGLAVLAFLGAGYTPGSRYAFREGPEDPPIRFGDVVQKGLRWLLDRQDAEGCFGKQEGEFLYDHSIASLALTEAAALCATPLYKPPAQRGIDFLAKARNPGFAWRYGIRPGENDTSVTGWCVMALKSAELSGLAIDREAFAGARAWIERATSARGIVGYMSPGDAGSTLQGVNDRWKCHPAMTAVGLLSRIFIDKKRDAWMKVAAQEIVKDLPEWDRERHTVDYYYWYYAALALFQYDAPNGSAWKAFSASMEKALIRNQETEACRRGSWDPAVDKWGAVGGRVYATALNVLTLEVYFRYPSVFTGAREGKEPKA